VEISPELKITSRYQRPILSAVEEIYPRHSAAVEKILQNLDGQGVANYDFYYPENFPGVRIPYTRVSVNETAQSIVGFPDRRLSGERIVLALFQPWCLPPAGHPFDLWGEIYHRSFQTLIRTTPRNDAQVPQYDIYSIGLPHSFSGTVTEDWLEGLRKQGFSQYGQTYAQLLRENVLNTAHNVSTITLEGLSMGAVLADKTAVALPELADEDRLKLFFYIPTGFHSPIQRLYKSVQLPLGFFGEVGFRRSLDKNFKVETDAENNFLGAMRVELEKKGMTFDEESSALKTEAGKIDGINLLKGTQLESVVPITTVRGAFDPVNSNPVLAAGELLRVAIRGRNGENESIGSKLRIIHRGNQTEFIVHGSHYINYNEARVKSWMRALSTLQL
jgi:hypothetical protein